MMTVIIKWNILCVHTQILYLFESPKADEEGLGGLYER